ncbi:hypothetical protein E4U57_007074 [Claviceps arundinis]|uniref:Uncharacterized protein n=1 Tax=Claviceps arundinis TaxID=1623583 RepID=A0A9P7MLU8_9HYPO|nr:hypothetical protein E4U57_007074 [Claviceps arundinis]KAG5955930.1 hypothetical protein E4U56_006839 [Claviceps arundinis]
MSKPKPASRSRGPPPVLFLHPSASASHVSLTSPRPSTVIRTGPVTPARREQPSLDRSTSFRHAHVVVSYEQCIGQSGSSPSTAKADALWAEMQNVLEGADLSASGGSNVFSHEHSQKLSDLRSAQIGLAQAWARSEADEVTVMGTRATIAFSGGRDLNSDLTSLVGSGPYQVQRMRTNNEENLLEPDLTGKPEIDIILGRKRREANDRYFQRVNDGVIDVVAKLKDVTVAMHAVEREGHDDNDDDGPPLGRKRRNGKC